MSDRNEERDLLIEAAVTAHRERDTAGRIQPSPAWCDLDEEGRERLFEEQLLSRWIERHVDERGLSSTGGEVVRRAMRISQADPEEQE